MITIDKSRLYTWLAVSSHENSPIIEVLDVKEDAVTYHYPNKDNVGNNNGPFTVPKKWISWTIHPKDTIYQFNKLIDEYYGEV